MHLAQASETGPCSVWPNARYATYDKELVKQS